MNARYSKMALPIISRYHSHSNIVLLLLLFITTYCHHALSQSAAISTINTSTTTLTCHLHDTTGTTTSLPINATIATLYIPIVQDIPNNQFMSVSNSTITIYNNTLIFNNTAVNNRNTVLYNIYVKPYGNLYADSYSTIDS